MPTRRHFGSIRKLPSGRYQASYWHEGNRHIAGRAFATKGEAQHWLTTTETDILRGGWVDPEAGHVTLAGYANAWLRRRPDLRPSTTAKYRLLLDKHVLPQLGDVAMGSLKPSRVRDWWAALAAVTPSTAAGAYRLLSTICKTAVSDQVIARSPCQIKGAGVERAPERPTATIAELEAAVEAASPRWRLAFLLAAWCQLRRGEILGLQRRDVDLLHDTLSIDRAIVVHSDGNYGIGPPKTEAGRRTIAVPPNVIDELERHLDTVGPEADAWLFEGGQDPNGVLNLERAWHRARAAIGRPDLHLHDLRHSGLTWSAAIGATTAELMHRAGHASSAASLRYQHATKDRDRAIADALADLKTGKVTPITPRRRNASRT